MTNNERRENEKGRVGVRGNPTIDQEVEECWCVVVLVASKCCQRPLIITTSVPTSSTQYTRQDSTIIN
jgi:hypothetical protein